MDHIAWLLNTRPGREVIFSLPGGKIIPSNAHGRGPGQLLDRDAPVSPSSRGNVIEITKNNHKKGLRITPETAVPRWHGEKMDYSVGVEMLLECESGEDSH